MHRIDPDSALVMSIRTGDKKALAALVEKHKKMAFRTALGMVGNREDAYDISQEAFLRVYRSAETYDQKQPFLPWFYAIIANLSKTWLKRRQVAARRSLPLEETEYLISDDASPESQVIEAETIQRLRQALLQLDFDDREIIMLQHFRNMSYDEIAETLGIPRGTVMSRLYYARKKLANLMRRSDG
ncbi:MAG: RNA polymerase sigma factor [candidate division Zixibacteria bacterium]|nr:RNA polymerase sigma factor [candidate division Zixibacteria bacterium]